MSEHHGRCARASLEADHLRSHGMFSVGDSGCCRRQESLPRDERLSNVHERWMILLRRSMSIWCMFPSRKKHG